MSDLNGAIWERYQDDDVVVIGLASGGETSDDVAYFIETFLIDFPVVYDAGVTYLSYLQDWATSPYPLDYIIDQEGKIAYFNSEYDTDGMIASIDALLGNAPEIRVEPASVDLGGVLMGESAWTLVTVYNDGLGDLHVNGIESSNPEFSLNLSEMVIIPGGSQALLVNFTPSELGPHHGQLTLLSDDADESTILIDLYGEGVSAVGADTWSRPFALEQNEPNPFTGSTAIRFSLDADSDMSLGVYDVRGRLVRKLESSSMSQGEHTQIWDGRDERGRRLPAGVYFYKLSAGGRERTRKAVLLR